MLTVEEQIRLIADAAMDALDLDTAAERRAIPRATVLEPMPVADTSSPVEFTEEVVTMIDVKTKDPPEPRQKRPIRIVVAGILAAAAAVVAIVFVASSDVDVVTPADEPSPTVTVPSTTPPRALFSQPFEDDLIALAAGTYFVDEVDGAPTPRIFFTIGAGWWVSCDKCMFKRGIGRVSFSQPGRVFSDACHWSDGYHPGPVTTLDGFVAALSEQGGWADVTTPSDISVDGYAGKAFQRTVPAEILDCGTIPGSAQKIPDGLGDHAFLGWDNGPIYEPGEVVTVWVLDIDGTVVVIQAVLFPSMTTGVKALAGPTEAARAEFAAVFGSIRIDRG